MAAAAILDNLKWPYLRNDYLYSARRAVIFAIAQLSCYHRFLLTFLLQFYISYVLYCLSWRINFVKLHHLVTCPIDMVNIVRSVLLYSADICPESKPLVVVIDMNIHVYGSSALHGIDAIHELGVKSDGRIVVQ